MKKRVRHINKLKEYLSVSTLPEAEARKLYWNNYKAMWRKKRRVEQKEFTISYTVSEVQTITKAARAHNRSTTSYIKEASLAYTAHQFLVPDLESINQVKELMSLIYTRVQHLTEDEKLADDKGEKMLSIIMQIESTILNLLTNPDKR